MRPRGFTGVVLAGGRSSRMGRDKALLVLDGSTLLDIAITHLRDAGADRVVVSGDRASHDGIADRVPGRGPVGGLASVVADCPDGPLIAVPVDMPDLGRRMLVRLRDALGDARAAHFRGHPLPCALDVDAAARTAMDALVAASPAGPSMRALLAALGAVELEIEDERLLRNINTPADWTARAS